MKEFQILYALLLVCAVAGSVPMPASSAIMLAADNGMTVYVFDKDKNGVPTCYDNCQAVAALPRQGRPEDGRGLGHDETKGRVHAIDYRDRPVCL